MEESKSPQTFSVTIGREYEKGINELLSKITKVRVSTHYIGGNKYKIDLVTDNKTLTTISVVARNKIPEKLGEIYWLVYHIVQNKIQ